MSQQIGLDPAGIKELRKELINISHKEGTAVLVSSHLLGEMEILCDKIAIIDEGKILKVTDVKPKYEKEKITEYIFKVKSIENVDKCLNGVCEYNIFENELHISYAGNISIILKILIENEFEIESFYKKQQTLEDRFFEIVGGN